MEELPEEVRVMRDTIRRFVEEELDPIADQVEEQDRDPRGVARRAGFRFGAVRAPVARWFLGQCFRDVRPVD